MINLIAGFVLVICGIGLMVIGWKSRLPKPTSELIDSIEVSKTGIAQGIHKITEEPFGITVRSWDNGGTEKVEIIYYVIFSNKGIEFEFVRFCDLPTIDSCQMMRLTFNTSEDAVSFARKFKTFDECMEYNKAEKLKYDLKQGYYDSIKSEKPQKVSPPVEEIKVL